MTFTNERDFETALVNNLSTKYGWEEVLYNCTEEKLIQNWADILFQNNQGIDRLNNCPLTDGEMGQIMEKVISLRTPFKLNGFINGGTVSIKRDNPDDADHFGKEVFLELYDRQQIGGGNSRYQIVRQPNLGSKHALLGDRRGDLMLLIYGMPVIHIELKRSGVSVSHACDQIKRYSAEGVLSNNLFSLIQVFVAMTPEEAVYFANPGRDGKFNPNFYFHWADFDNEHINNWDDVAKNLLFIPMAHQLIGYYMVADKTDEILKVMRSYQIHAVQKIYEKVEKQKWGTGNQRGGFIWHTTGSGKTMTSFKAARRIAESGNADKVVFIVDRIELGTQSLNEYRNFAAESEDVQETEDTHVLIQKLKSKNPADTLIVTSIHKMSKIREDHDYKQNATDIAKIQSKRIVFIVDECHRTTFGDMMMHIKETFPNALFFGFTGTPIHEENKKKDSTTATVFGDELHRYSIADGLRDKNVLGFDPYKILTYQDDDIRREVALKKVNAKTVEEAKKSALYYEVMNKDMAGRYDDAGEYIKGIEDDIPHSQYELDDHKNMVIEDIKKHITLKHNGKFHAIFATSSIKEAIEYYRRIKEKITELKTTALFDKNIDENKNRSFKEEGLCEIIEDYNARYGQNFTISEFYNMKKDIAARLAHKKPYLMIENEPDKQIDLLIVVDQMLTGFDSKWIDTLYIDKILQNEQIIQAFSRTNRVFNHEKTHGTIRYYRQPHTMERYIKEAVKLYSGDKEFCLFVDKLDKNISGMNFIFSQIKSLFERAKINYFSKLPDDVYDRKRFVELFNKFNRYLQAAKVQGFTWEKLSYEFEEETIEVALDKKTYETLLRRYQELSKQRESGAGEGEKDIPYDIEGYLMDIQMPKIDYEYINEHFTKYIKTNDQKELDELHKSIAALPEKEQRYAKEILDEVFVPQEGKEFSDCITERMGKAEDERIHKFASDIGVDEEKLRKMISLRLTENNIGVQGRDEELEETIDKQKARAYFELKEGKSLNEWEITKLISKELRAFILSGGED